LIITFIFDIYNNKNVVMKNLILFIFTLLMTFSGLSQYCNTATTNETITPTTTLQYTPAYAAGRRAFNFYAEAGNEYTFSTVGQTTVDTYLRLYSTATGGSVLAWSDDYFNTQSEITWYCTTSGNYSILLTRWSASSTCNTINASAIVKYQKGSTAGSTIVSIGSGEGVVYNAPANHYYKYGWSEIIYLQSEINTEGNITKIRFQVDPTTPGPYTATNQKIYMGHTTLSVLPSPVSENAQTNYVSSNYTLVYDGSVTWNIGWNEIALQTPFPWNNTNNLLIKWENRNGTYTFDEPWFYYTSKTNTVGYSHQDASYPTSNGVQSSLRPNIKIALSDPNPLPVELSTFNGVNKGPNNYLFWSTVSEQNTSHFNLQKSRDGEIWTTIATLNAAGNSTQEITYDVVDFKVDPNINYYRLQQYDLNGVYDTFGPITINNIDLESKKTIIKYVNLNGQEIDPEKLKISDVYVEIYDDGTMRKVIR
jgi:hypothetical protein